MRKRSKLYWEMKSYLMNLWSLSPLVLLCIRRIVLNYGALCFWCLSLKINILEGRVYCSNIKHSTYGFEGLLYFGEGVNALDDSICHDLENDCLQSISKLR